MSRTRRILLSFLPGRRDDANDGGFSLIEVIVALSLLVTVMATTAGFFTTSLKQSNGQTQAQEAAVAPPQQQLDYTRSVAATSLAFQDGRKPPSRPAHRQPPARPISARTSRRTGNYDTTVPDRASSQAVPITMNATVGGTHVHHHDLHRPVLHGRGQPDVHRRHDSG